MKHCIYLEKDRSNVCRTFYINLIFLLLYVFIFITHSILMFDHILGMEPQKARNVQEVT